MTDDVLLRRTEESAAAEPSHGAEWNARPGAAPLNAMGANVTIQNPWADMKTGKMNNDTLVSIVGK